MRTGIVVLATVLVKDGQRLVVEIGVVLMADRRQTTRIVVSRVTIVLLLRACECNLILASFWEFVIKEDGWKDQQYSYSILKHQLGEAAADAHDDGWIRWFVSHERWTNETGVNDILGNAPL
jgi:hypothetical protein